MAAKTVTKSISVLSRETSALAAVIRSPMSAGGARIIRPLNSALLTAMKIDADRPLPATSPISRKRRRSSSMKKS